MEHKTFLCWAVTLSIDRLPESRSGSGILQVPDQMFIQKKKKDINNSNLLPDDEVQGNSIK